MFVLTLIANEIAPSGSGADSSRNCIRVDRVLVDFDSRQVLRVRHLIHNFGGLNTNCHTTQIRFISRIGPTSDQLERAVQYTYRFYQAKRDGTPNEPVSSREILVIDPCRLEIYACSVNKRVQNKEETKPEYKEA